MRSLIFVIGIAMMNGVYAGDLTIPNTFVAGTPARAAEVNDNFSAVETAVDDNDARITTNSADITTNASGISTNASNITSNETRIEALETVKSIKAVDANDLVIGELVSINALGMSFDVFTTQEYLEVDIPMSPRISGEDAFLSYLTTDCTGAPYSQYPNGTVHLALQPNTVYAKYYTPKSSVAQNVTVQSMTDDSPGPCRTLVGNTPDWYFPASQNVPAITGVADVMYTFPITFQRQ